MADRYADLPKWARDEIEAMQRGLCWHCGKPPYVMPPARTTDASWGPPLEAVQDALNAVPKRFYDLLRDAEAQDWRLGSAGTTLVMRLHKPGDEKALPFYACWDLIAGKDGKKSWRFHGARAANGQRLNWNDIRVYLADPDVIYPEPPEGGEAA